MKILKYLWIGFKNAYTTDIKKDYPVKNLWDISNKIENKFQKINYETSEKIKKHASIY
jgi:outer membrane cobalamin receptor